jgi:NAD(P)-dependent dehydrogenase (short-subunit alcohol dehydrogenase family)
MDLKNKVALITGGTKGIGAETAVLFARQGASVAVVGRHRDDSVESVLGRIEREGATGEFLQADFADQASGKRCVEETVSRFGGLDVLVHSAGGNVLGGLMEVSEEEWYRGFEVHVHAVYHLCRAAIPLMKSRGGGAVVLVSSVAGIRGVKTNIAYQAVKGAIPQIARGLAYEFSEDNIRVNAVAPGIIRTPFHKNMPEAARQHNIDNRIPLHREGTPLQIATAILELATNDYITGETLTVDGGLTMRIA